MRRSARPEQPLRDLIDIDLPAGELERLTRVAQILRLAADRDRADTTSRQNATHRAADCERMRRSISATLDRELSEAGSESVQIREHLGRRSPPAPACRSKPCGPSSPRATT